MSKPATNVNSELARAAESIRNGLLVAYPTDTFYALGADAMNPVAVERVFRAKARAPASPVPVLVESAAMTERLARDFPDRMRDLADRFWPGPLTLVLPATDVVPDTVTAGTGNIGLRVPDHEIARALIGMSNSPLTGTSCNMTGRPPTKDADIVEHQFNTRIAVCIHAPCGEHTAPSTVIGVAGDREGEAGSGESGSRLKIFRAGAIDIDSIRKVIGYDSVG